MMVDVLVQVIGQAIMLANEQRKDAYQVFCVCDRVCVRVRVFMYVCSCGFVGLWVWEGGNVGYSQHKHGHNVHTHAFPWVT